MLSESALMASSTLQSAISCSICRKSIIIGAKLRNKTKISKTVRLQGLGKAVKNGLSQWRRVTPVLAQPR